MNKHALYHTTDVPYAYGVGDKLHVVLRTAHNDIKKVRLLFTDRYDWVNDNQALEMTLKNSNYLFDYYEADLFVESKRYRYYFEITDKDDTIAYYSERGFCELPPEKIVQIQYPYSGEADLYKEIDWVSEGVVYQIFPDRFNNVGNTKKTLSKWGELPTGKSFFGGNIKGITQKLDYLADIGINMLYMTPLFESSSNHKYNTKDYYTIDKNFGTEDDFKELVKCAHDRNIKVILDAVFNHSGSDFFAFKDLIKNGEKSKYVDWYFPTSFPVDTKKINYVTFAEKISAMPKINMSCKEARNYFCEVGAYWVEKFDIDGWRLDVSDEVDHMFWQEFRSAVRSKKDDVFIVGEIQHEAPSFLRGNEMDSIMNYSFRNVAYEFFAKRTLNAEAIDFILSESRALYTDAINRQKLNLYGSHDTERFFTACNKNKDTFLLATAFKFTYVGVPYVYYGDEIAMEGANDPDCRRCMDWSGTSNQDVYETIKKLIKLRTSEKALVYGDFKTVYKNDFVYAYTRTLNESKILVILNNSSVPAKFLNKLKYKDAICPTNRSKTVEAFGFRILKVDEEIQELELELINK